MFVRKLLVLSYIFYCCKLRVAPWKYFQLNANYFNEHSNLFSKLDMDQLIPTEWRLPQFVDHGSQEPQQYPVFAKPEWGQNSQGVVRIDDANALQLFRATRPNKAPRYLIQQAAAGAKEFEIFFVPKSHDGGDDIVSITETENNSNESLPVNGIYNNNTLYTDRLPDLSSEQLEAIISHIKKIGDFRISRYGLRADSIEDVVKGLFSIIEINVYLPMPLVLLAGNVAWSKKLNFIFATMHQLVLVTKHIPKNQPIKSIFFKKLKYSRCLKEMIKNELS